MTNQAPQQVIRRGGDFLRQHGRRIDQALFAHRFEGAPLEPVIEELESYQNPDGGFTGLEVDIAAPQSNPFATEIALVIVRWGGIAHDHPLVLRAVDYLEQTQEPNGDWRFTPEIYQHALPPWFQHWQWPNLNPSTTIAGLLRQLGLGSRALHQRAEKLFDQLAKPEDLTGEEYYSVRPYGYYLQALLDHPLADLYRWGVVWWVTRQFTITAAHDASHLLDFAPQPQSEIAQRLPAGVRDGLLDLLVSQQQEDGGWPSPYDPRWRPWVTITSLLTLHAYNRI